MNKIKRKLIISNINSKIAIINNLNNFNKKA